MPACAGMTAEMLMETYWKLSYTPMRSLTM